MTIQKTLLSLCRRRPRMVLGSAFVMMILSFRSFSREDDARKGVESGNRQVMDLQGHLTDSLAHTRYRESILPLALAMFDWTVYNDNENILKRRQKPRYVFCQASKSSINRLADEFPADHVGSVLLVGGEDLHLSEAMEQTNLKRLVSKFNIIRYEAKDSDNANVDTFPMGLLPHYTMRHNDTEIRHSISSATLENKPNLLLAAWGKVWPHLDEMKSRKEAYDFVNSVAWVERKSVDLGIWWRTLKLYKFMLCPTGNGIQSPKYVEAFLTLTIPVVQNESAYFDLKQQGFPFLIVDSWNEITPDFLERQWKLLSPKLYWAQSMFITDRWYHFVTRSSDEAGIEYI
jgi:hypothetical protein